MTDKRRSFVLLKLTPAHRPREKVWKVVKAIQELSHVSSNGKKIWAGLTKTPQERKRASLASITSKLKLWRPRWTEQTLTNSISNTPAALSSSGGTKFPPAMAHRHLVTPLWWLRDGWTPYSLPSYFDSTLQMWRGSWIATSIGPQLQPHQVRSIGPRGTLQAKTSTPFKTLTPNLDIILLQKVGAQPEGVAVISLEDFWAALGKPFCFAKLCFPRSFNLISGGRPFGAPWARVTLAGSFAALPHCGHGAESYSAQLHELHRALGKSRGMTTFIGGDDWRCQLHPPTTPRRRWDPSHPPGWSRDYSFLETLSPHFASILPRADPDKPTHVPYSHAFQPCTLDYVITNRTGDTSPAPITPAARQALHSDHEHLASTTTAAKAPATAHNQKNIPHTADAANGLITLSHRCSSRG